MTQSFNLQLLFPRLFVFEISWPVVNGPFSHSHHVVYEMYTARLMLV